MASSATSSPAQVADGVYTGVTTQNRPVTVTVSGGTIIGYSIQWAGMCSASGTATVSTSCPITGNSFNCGTAVCGAPGASSASITGAFEGAHVRATANLSYMSPSFCCGNLTSMHWLASIDSLLLDEGFETGSLGAWTTATGGPFLELHLRNRFWKNDGSDTLQAKIDGTTVLSLREAVPGWQPGYRKALVDLSAFAGGAHDLSVDATSAVDATEAWFFLDDVSITCPGGANAVGDPSFEAGNPNPSWTASATVSGTPICNSPGCSSTPGARTGTWWAWFGRGSGADNGSVSQSSVPVPTCP